MVVALGPGKFYGSSLPRPRFYTDIKNSERVDPPGSVMDPLMQWANEAHWSMGGRSFKRLRLQGRIEGNVEKLRVQMERTFKKRSASSVSQDNREDGCETSKTPSPPPAPVGTKRCRFVGIVDEHGDELEGLKKRGAVRKLGDDFEKVATESGMIVDDDSGSGGSERDVAAKQARKLVKGSEKVGAAVRKSPRLSKNRSN